MVELEVEPRSSLWLPLVLFAAIAVLITWDLWLDFREGSGWPHLVIESLVLGGASTGMIIFARAYRRTRRCLDQARVEAAQWRAENQELMQGLAIAIQRQFQRWQLTPAESEVGLLLLKGLTHREVADARRTTERTAREQSRAVYRKSGLPGRQALSAFFLEDVLLPRSPSDPTNP